MPSCYPIHLLFKLIIVRRRYYRPVDITNSNLLVYVDLKTGKEDSKDSTNFMVRVIQSNKCVLCCSAPL